MKRMSVGLLVCAIWLLLAGMAWAESPVLLSHTLQGSSKGADSVTWNFSLHVINTGDAPLRDLALSYVPLLVMAREEVNLNVPEIEAHGQTDIKFDLTTPALSDEKEISLQSFHWAGKCLDEQGKTLEFPVASNPGGAL